MKPNKHMTGKELLEKAQGSFKRKKTTEQKPELPYNTDVYKRTDKPKRV